MVDNNSKAKPSQDFSTNLFKSITGTKYTKGKGRRPSRRRYAVTPETTLYNKDLSDNAHRIYEVISRFTGDKDGKEARVGRKYIAEKLGKSIRTVDRGLEELENKGFAIRTQRGNKGNGGRSVTYTTLKENYHQSELDDGDFFNQPYSAEFYERIAENDSVFDIEDGVVKAKLDMTLEDWDKELHDKYVEQPPRLPDKYVEQPPDDKDSSQQGKRSDFDPLSREVKEFIKRSNYGKDATTSPNGSVSASALQTPLKGKKPINNYDTGDLAEVLQLVVEHEGIEWRTGELDAGKLRGQLGHVKRKLGGARKVLKFFDWYFRGDKRKTIFKRAEDAHKMAKLMDGVDDYKELHQLRQKQGREDLINQIYIESFEGQKLDFNLSELEKKNESQLVHILAKLKGEETPVKT